MDAVKGATKKISVDGKNQTVKIPPGVDSGSRIRFNEYEVLIEVREHSRYKREGYNIVTEEEISFPQAVLGTEIKVDTVEGEVKLKIPSGTEPGTVIRLSKKGVKHIRGSGQGDHYVKIKVVIPKNLTKKQKDLLKEFDNSPKKKSWF